MMSCKEVTTLIARGELTQAPLARRLAVRLHLALCRHCRAFQRQLDAISRAARSATAAVAGEPGSEFEATLIRRMREDRPQPK